MLAKKRKMRSTTRMRKKSKMKSTTKMRKMKSTPKIKKMRSRKSLMLASMMLPMATMKMKIQKRKSRKSLMLASMMAPIAARRAAAMLCLLCGSSWRTGQLKLLSTSWLIAGRSVGHTD